MFLRSICTCIASLAWLYMKTVHSWLWLSPTSTARPSSHSVPHHQFSFLQSVLWASWVVDWNRTGLSQCAIVGHLGGSCHRGWNGMAWIHRSWHEMWGLKKNSLHLQPLPWSRWRDARWRFLKDPRCTNLRPVDPRLAFCFASLLLLERDSYLLRPDK